MSGEIKPSFYLSARCLLNEKNIITVEFLTLKKFFTTNLQLNEIDEKPNL